VLRGVSGEVFCEESVGILRIFVVEVGGARLLLVKDLDDGAGSGIRTRADSKVHRLSCLEHCVMTHVFRLKACALSTLPSGRRIFSAVIPAFWPGTNGQAQLVGSVLKRFFLFFHVFLRVCFQSATRW